MTGLDKTTGLAAADDGPAINAAMSSANADHPLCLVLDGGACVSGLKMPAGGHWSIVGFGKDTGIFVQAGTNNHAIHNGTSNLGVAQGTAAPPRGANVSSAISSSTETAATRRTATPTAATIAARSPEDGCSTSTWRTSTTCASKASPPTTRPRSSCFWTTAATGSWTVARSTPPRATPTASRQRAIERRTHLQLTLRVRRRSHRLQCVRGLWRPDHAHGGGQLLLVLTTLGRADGGFRP